jgi:hypothetical protein
MMVVSVTLPPGRFRLATSPICTGSAPIPNTIGMVAVAAFAARPSSAISSYKYRDLILIQLRSKLRQSPRVRLCPSVFDLDVLALYVTCRAERLSERTHTEGIGFSRSDRENADHRHRQHAQNVQ